MQAIQAAAEMEVKLKKAEDKVDDLESQLMEKSGLFEDATKSLDILKNRLEQKVSDVQVEAIMAGINHTVTIFNRLWR